MPWVAYLLPKIQGLHEACRDSTKPVAWILYKACLFRGFAWMPYKPVGTLQIPLCAMALQKPFVKSPAWVLCEVPCWDTSQCLLPRGFVKPFPWMLCKFPCLEWHEMCRYTQNSHVCQILPMGESGGGRSQVANKIILLGIE